MVRVEFGKARCRFHGGLSTGPKTEAGRSRIAEAQRRRWRAFRDARQGNVIELPPGEMESATTEAQPIAEIVFPVVEMS
jgi:hypothetical protein